MVAAILGAFSLLVGFFRGLKDLFSDRVGRGILLMVVLLILIGTVFYSLVEGWSLIDSFYFSVITLTTVGYGDFHPETTLGKLVTTVYIFLGLSIIATFASTLAKTHAQRIAAKHRSRSSDDQTNDSA